MIVEDASNSFVVFDVGMGMPSPPSLTGKAISFLSSSLSACLPVISGSSSYLITSSRGWNNSSMSGTSLIRYVHLAMTPWVNAAYAA